MNEQSKINLKEIESEIEFAIEFLSTPRNYHGSTKHSLEWHKGWETAAHGAMLSLRMIKGLLCLEMKILRLTDEKINNSSDEEVIKFIRGL